MWLRIAKKFKFEYVQDDEVYYRQLDNSLMRTLQKGSLYFQEHFNVLYKHIGNLDKNNSKQIVKQLYNLYKANLKRTKSPNLKLTGKLFIAIFKSL